jgi:hypothetical protein
MVLPNLRMRSQKNNERNIFLHELRFIRWKTYKLYTKEKLALPMVQVQVIGTEGKLEPVVELLSLFLFLL